MARIVWNAALAAMLLAAPLTGARAQQAAPPKPATPPAAAPQTPPATAPDKLVPPSNPNVVGMVNGKEITFDQVIARVQKDNPDQFKAALAQSLGAKAAEQLFGDKAQPSVTLTQADALAAMREKPSVAIYNTLEGMLREEALNQEAAKQGVTVTDAQASAYLDKILKKLRADKRIQPNQTDDDFLAQQPGKLTRTSIIASLHQQLTVLALTQKQAEAKQGRPFGPQDVVQVRHILILSNAAPMPMPGQPKPADPVKQNAAALAKINKIYADIKAGKITFEAAARANSEDPGSKAKGGNMDPFTHGVMVPEFDKAAFALTKDGEIVGPVKTQYGYHIIQLVKTGAELTPAERQDALDANNQRGAQTYIQTLASDRNKLVNNLPRPAMPMPGMMPGMQGGPPPGGPQPR